MKIIDLNHTISPNMPVYPGTEAPEFSTPCTIKEMGFLERKLTLYSHTGTHIDAPAHIIPGAKALDQMTPDRFVGKGALIKLRGKESSTIEVDFLKSHQQQIERCEFLLFHTGWGDLWGKDAYYQGYPVLSHDAAAWLSGFPLKGIGADTISADEAGSVTFPIHTVLLEHDIVIIENLTNLEALPDHGFDFFCFPLKLEKADGSPVRAVGVFYE
ncbi:MAG: cyclase family protein [Thermodesulfobacteriota bacterium]